MKLSKILEASILVTNLIFPLSSEARIYEKYERTREKEIEIDYFNFQDLHLPPTIPPFEPKKTKDNKLVYYFKLTPEVQEYLRNIFEKP